MPLLSIIIPVYNAEKYLDECLQSILKQNVHNIEIILVNNASTDQSGEICDRYASQYSNFKVIHLLENALPAGARNAGFQIATGQYIHFCDSDDYYVEDCFSKIANKLNHSKPSVLIGQYICRPEKGAFVSEDVIMDSSIVDRCDANEMADYLLQLPHLQCMPWRLIVKRELLIRQQIIFPEGVHSEDEEWFPKVICTAGSFTLLPEPFYVYRTRATGSVTSIKTFLYTKSHLVVALNLLSFLQQMQYTDARFRLLFSRAQFLLSLFSTRCDTFTEEQMVELAEIIERNLDLMDTLKERTKEPSPLDVLYDFVHRYGPLEGLKQYRTYVIDNTLELVRNKKHKDIYIFPTGYNGEATARILRQSGYQVKGFLDNSESKNGHTIDGIPVSLPEKLRAIPLEQKEQLFVLICTQHENIKPKLMNQLRELGLKDSQFASRTY